jgi:aminoglycoside 3-N-acetyltransferase
MKKNNNLLELRKVLNDSFKQLEIKKYSNAFIASDISCLSKLRLKKNDICETIFNSLKSSLAKQSTIFVPTGNINLCNTNTIFDLYNTPSKNMGTFSEYVRKKKETIRSLHPFWSISANGINSKLLKNVSKHSYGVGSPWSIMLDLDTVQINIGKHPSRAITLIHHLETVSGVPYRYNKQFFHKIKLKNRILTNDFYMSVFFKKINAKKKINLNKHYFNELKKRKKLYFTKNNFGLGIWSFKMRDFYSVVIQEMKKNIFNYLESDPKLNLIKNY